MPFLRRIRKLLCPDVESFAKDAEQGHPDSIKQRGWLQWSCVGSADLLSTLRSTALDAELASLSTDVRLLIVSQSCDLIHHSYESEPFAEVYLCEALAHIVTHISAGALQISINFHTETQRHGEKIDITSGWDGFPGANPNIGMTVTRCFQRTDPTLYARTGDFSPILSASLPPCLRVSV